MNHVIKNEDLTVAVSGRGAELQFVLGVDGTEYLWQGDPKYWSDMAFTIFPFVARLFGGKYSRTQDLRASHPRFRALL